MLALGAAAVAVVALCGCGAQEARTGAPATGSASWVQLPPSPLTPRYSPLTVWDGSEFLFFGGYSGTPCPPSADCAAADPELADGAYYDPQASGWRTLAAAPVPVNGQVDGEHVVVGRQLYVLDMDGGAPSTTTFLRYDIAADRWVELPAPHLRDPWLVAAGDSVVAIGQSGPANVVFDTETDTWRPLPQSPLPGGGETGVWTGTGLLVAEHKDVPDDQAPVVRLALLDKDLTHWQPLPDSDIVGWAPVAVGGRVVWPSPEQADGGEVDNWGRSYAEGGIYDPATGSWTSLPPLPDNGGLDCCVATDRLVSVHGNLLDPVTRRWTAVSGLPGGSRNSPGVAGGDDVAVVWGGTPFGREQDGSLATGYLLRLR